MLRLSKLATLLVLCALGAVVTGCAARRPTAQIEPRADEALRLMSRTLSHARGLSVRIVTTMDEPTESGQFAQATRETQIVLRRPDRLFMEAHSGERRWSLWCADKTLTIVDSGAGTYASVPVPGRLDATLDHVVQKHELTLPMADLLFSEPYKALTADVRAGHYVGLHRVDGVKCHHLLFTQELLDWQIWIDAAGQAVPRKLVIDYRSVPERPQLTMVMHDWNLAANPGADQFKPNPPRDARKVEMSQLLAAGRGE